MDTKKIRKTIAYFLGWVGLHVCSLIMKVLPEKWLYGFAGGVARIGFRLAGKQRRIALESLSIAFAGTKSPREIEQAARECFRYMAKSAFEMLFLMDKPEEIKRRVVIEGKEHLDKAMAKGKGVILVSAHFGNFPVLLSKLQLEGYPVSCVMRRMKDERTEELFRRKREKIGIKTIYSQPRHVCVETMIRNLRGNELVFVLLDQNFGTAGVFVNFFNRQAATATGPVVLSQRTGAAIMPCFIVRQPDDSHKIIFEPEMPLLPATSEQDTVQLNIQRLTDIIETYIRKYPAEWGWIHRRWKSRPQDASPQDASPQEARPSNS